MMGKVNNLIEKSGILLGKKPVRPELSRRMSCLMYFRTSTGSVQALRAFDELRTGSGLSVKGFIDCECETVSPDRAS
jgi:hypothetical protein